MLSQSHSRFRTGVSVIVNEKLQKTIDKLANCADCHLKLETIVHIGKKLKPLEESEKRDENLIPGCLSRVWLTGEVEDGRIYFRGDSDAVIMKGIVAILTNCHSGICPKMVVDFRPECLQKLDIPSLVSPNRRNGTANIIKRMKEIALAHCQEGERE